MLVDIASTTHTQENRTFVCDVPVILVTKHARLSQLPAGAVLLRLSADGDVDRSSSVSAKVTRTLPRWPNAEPHI